MLLSESFANIQLVVHQSNGDAKARAEEGDNARRNTGAVLTTLGERKRLREKSTPTVSEVFSMCRLRRATCIADVGIRAARSEEREADRKTDMVGGKAAGRLFGRCPPKPRGFIFLTSMGARASGDGEAVPLRRTGNVSHIGNKHKRQDIYQKYKKEKARLKLQRRLKTAKEERTSTEGKQKRKVRRYADPGTACQKPDTDN